jgi:hypothetical protein
MRHVYQEFIDLEMSLSESLERGVYQFSPPLRMSMSPAQYSVIFRNIEKVPTLAFKLYTMHVLLSSCCLQISVLSSHHLSLLKADEPDLSMSSPRQRCRCISAIYRANLSVLRDAFVRYVDGIFEADQMLTHVQVESKEALVAFLDQPVIVSVDQKEPLCCSINN